MMKRVRGELSRLDDSSLQPILIVKEKALIRVVDPDVAQTTSVLIHCAPDYPFNAPMYHNLPSLPKPLRFWEWVALILFRPTNIAFMPTHTQCMCCSSPLCAWSTAKRLRDVAAYALCVQDAAACIEAARYLRAALWRLPCDIVRHIVTLSGS